MMAMQSCSSFQSATILCFVCVIAIDTYSERQTMPYKSFTLYTWCSILFHLPSWLV